MRQRRSDSQMLRRFADAQVSSLSEYEVDVTICTSTSDALDGDVWVMEGIDLTRYLRHPIVLWDHDMAQPIGRASNIKVTSDKITARVTFPESGISPKADEIRGLVKSGIISGVSTGILPTAAVPRDRKDPTAGNRITESILMEFSIVAVPCDATSGVTARSNGGKTVAKRQWKVGATRDLPIEDGDAAWDMASAGDPIFALAKGDSSDAFDPTLACRGFLIYDAANPDDRASYRLPIARVLDGKLVVSKAALRAAADIANDPDIPDEVKAAARAIIDSYQGGDEGAPRQPVAPLRRAVNRASKRKVTIVNTRGLYDVANLCYLFQSLGYQVDSAKWEAAVEGDGSAVPGMLAGLLHDLGDALLAMAAEEVAEALAGYDVEPVVDDLDPEDRSYVLAGKTPAARSFRLGLRSSIQRSGKKFSAESARCLRSAQDKHGEAIDLHRRAIATHKEAMGVIDDLLDETDPDTDAVDTGGGETASDDEAERQRRARAAQLKAKALSFED